jgi:ribonuclease HII
MPGPSAKAGGPGLFPDMPLIDPSLVVCGLDEAGRGPLAGPVSAAAVILPQGFPLDILNDSKKLSAKRRDEAAREILLKARWGLGWAQPEEIDRINILKASLLAMERAFKAMMASGGDLPGIAVVDGLYVPVLGCRAVPLVKADALVPAVMAASIIAKTARDREMVRWSWIYPEYGYERHKGYPTAAHREICQRLGPSPIQRRSFSY